MNEWKQITKEIPKLDTYIIVTDGEEMWIDKLYLNNNKKLCWEFFGNNIIAWTQLPTNHKEFMKNYPMGDIYL